jgi:hypothetical protein
VLENDVKGKIFKKITFHQSIEKKFFPLGKLVEKREKVKKYQGVEIF